MIKRDDNTDKQDDNKDKEGMGVGLRKQKKGGYHDHNHPRRCLSVFDGDMTTTPSYMSGLMQELKDREKLFADTLPEEVKYWFEYAGLLQVCICICVCYAFIRLRLRLTEPCLHDALFVLVHCHFILIIQNQQRGQGGRCSPRYGHIHASGLCQMHRLLKFIEFQCCGIGAADNLEELNLFSTGLDCFVGVEDLEDTAIVSLILTMNNINEPIPDVFWRLESLQELSVSL